MSDLTDLTLETPKSRDQLFVAPSWANKLEELDYYIEGNKEDKVVLLNRLEGTSTWVIGRPNQENAFIELNHESISRQNSALIHVQGDMYLVDLKSAYGTHYDGEKIAPYKPIKIEFDKPIQFGKENTKFYLREGQIPSNKKRSYEDHVTHEAKRQKSQLKEVRASHILLKHKGSRRPMNWKKETITRTIDESKKQISEWREKIISGELDFDEIAYRYSDCSSARSKGDLDFFQRGQMQKAFEQAAFSLEVGEISDLVISDSGVHIIKRTA